jgi:hypothetical protein
VTIAAELLEALGYSASRHFVTPKNLDALPEGELAFAFRRLAEPLQADSVVSRFHGAYLIQDKPGGPAVPAVYVIETQNDTGARRIHGLVWNQNIVPFLILVSPSSVRLYPGFVYELGADAPLHQVAANVNAALQVLAAFKAEAIDDGTIWHEWGHQTDPMRRADASLLRDLKDLDTILQREHGASRDAAHGLIGKFVYLSYLRHREILSDRKLADWDITPRDLFTRYATLKAFRGVNENLQSWLNGSVFRFGDNALANITAEQLRAVAGVFRGDAPSGQLHLAFRAYNFAQIPIETLSCVYEQFLHDTSDGRSSRGKSLGAFYTPIPLADYMISELERKRPLLPGMKILDPSCGSGVFLVQCYRRLIEKRMRTEGRPLLKSELRALLTESIYGIDRDDDACRVTELSLILTLLDYIKPPDLENTLFQLPTLRDQNIFKDDFFLDDGPWRKTLGDTRFDWCVGNPPWAEVKGIPGPEHDHHPVSQWMTAHETAFPTGGHQIAEAFLWKAAQHFSVKGVAGLLVPAMTWFKKESLKFRRQFLRTHNMWCLANFANLAYVLFARRATAPAAAVFYASGPDRKRVQNILALSPFVAEQVANRPPQTHQQRVTWNIIINHADLRDVPLETALEGNGLTWKLAMWGTSRDQHLLERIIAKSYSDLETYAAKNGLEISEGSQLKPSTITATSSYKSYPDLTGKLTVDFTRLKGVGRIFAFPTEATPHIDKSEAYLRKRGGFAGLEVSKPPHLIVDASRRFAVYSDEYVFIPPRQIGIAGRDSDLLRALGIYLSSDFCTYHQFMTSPQWGVSKSRADLETLKRLPIRLDHLTASELKEWSALGQALGSLSALRFSTLGWQDSDEEQFTSLLSDANARVFKAVGLRSVERFLIEDFVRLNLELVHGKVADAVMRAPSTAEVKLYFVTVRNSLDSFLSPSQGLRHKIEAITSSEGAFFSVTAIRGPEPIKPLVTDYAASSTALRNMRDRLRERKSQWIYFDRALHRYERNVFQQFKPMQRLHWSRRQAILDADEIIAETIDHRRDA